MRTRANTCFSVTVMDDASVLGKLSENLQQQADTLKQLSKKRETEGRFHIG